MSADERAAVLRAYVGDRAQPPPPPGPRVRADRAIASTSSTDYGAFRDLQRHRLLTLEWQPLTPRHGYTEPDAIAEAGARDDWRA